MQITEVKKRKYGLTDEEILSILQAIDVLKIISNDNEICEVIQYEACGGGGGVGDAQDVLDVILSLDGTYIIDCQK